MHPEIVRDEPGSCPICGMALEPTTVLVNEENPELADMSRRFRVSLVLTLPVFALASALATRVSWATATISKFLSFSSS